MQLPNFSAEMSLVRSNNDFFGASKYFAGAMPMVVPQLEKQVMIITVGNAYNLCRTKCGGYCGPQGTCEIKCYTICE